MRISDWSSDVCSSDLPAPTVMAGTTRLVDESDIVCAVPPTAHRIALASVRKQRSAAFADAMMAAAASAGPINARRVLPLVHRLRIGLAPAALLRSEARRVGKECGRTGSTRW